MRKSAFTRNLLSFVAAIVGSASLVSCGSASDDVTPDVDHDHDHDHDHDRDAIPPPAPELPRLPSRALEYVPHHPGVIARDTSGAYSLVAGSRRINQRVLLLGATGGEPAFLAARDALVRIGVPYQSLLAATQEVTAAMLSDGVSTCNFSGVIMATSGLGYVEPGSGSWQSALSLAEWQLLSDFERACSAREVVWYAWPGAEFGLAPGPAFDSDTAVDAQLTAEGVTFFRRVKSTARIPIRQSYGYRASVADPATTTALVTATDGGVLVARHISTDGRETLVSTVDSSPYLTHSLLLEYDMLRWLNRDLFVGKKRSYLSPQVDDLFLDNDMWVIGQGNQGTTQFRITGTDLTAFAEWHTARRASLPAGSTFMTDMAFNGYGTLVAEYPDTTLLAAARAAGDQLVWLNHTWDHENLDALTRSQTSSELIQNNNLAVSLGLNGYRRAELVTPDMSGLANINALRGMFDGGARYVVSDTSITEALRPNNPGTNPAFNVGRFNPLDSRIYHIPRHPTSIFYDVASPETAIDEYNTIYRSYYGRDLSYAELIDKDSAFGLYYLLQGDIDPLMFHQANLASYPSNGRLRSIYADWIDAVVGKYLALTNAPILTSRETETAAAMKARGNFNICGVTATVVEAATVASLELRTVGACTVPITGLSRPGFGTVENYAGEPTTSVNMTAGAVRTIPIN
jgi:hypothetical protein